MASWIGIGVMSGSSLDGLDMCCAEFTGDCSTDTWSYRILHATTISYSPEWTERLSGATTVSGKELMRMHAEYGRYVGELVNKFIDDYSIEAKYVASHGHTVFHQPQNGFTFQIGDGETMVSSLRIPLITNFRNKDVALGGQGAPLVPVGETYLFGDYDLCLNFGGICNLTINEKGFDICVCNMMLNTLAQRHDEQMAYDKDGAVARKGQIIPEVLLKMNLLSYYSQPPPKSLGREWFDTNMLPIISDNKYSAQDLLRTAVEHITDQVIAAVLVEMEASPLSLSKSSLLITGGGALNSFLIERLKEKIEQANLGIIIKDCDEDTIQYKEAVIFAFLGLRCLLGLPNVCKCVTGASTDSVSGSIHLPPFNYSLTSNACQDYRFHFRAASSPGMIPLPLRRHRSSSCSGSNLPMA